MKQLLNCLAACLFVTSLFAQDNETPTPQWRPVYHFTPQKYWTNDPNGLIYFNGEYHMYNQQNPFENKWGHMSWGHATSKDLVTWKHLPIAIPETIDKDTTWRFSGSAVWDKNNTSGFCKGAGCLVAIYTADQPNLKKESQFIAYSNDGGMSYTNYEGNPVIDLQKKDFRDPNVFWYEPSGQWIMAVALPTEFKIRFYTSPDLKKWELLSEFGPQGYAKAAWECPFLIQLPVDGNAKKQKWVLMVSSGGPKGWPFMQYFVGDFDGKNFKNDNPSDSMLTVDFGDSFYAAIPWNNLPGDKKTFIGWMVPGPQETAPWKGQMSIPRDLGLKETKNGTRLVQFPAAVIQHNLAKLSHNQQIEIKDLKIGNGESIIDQQHKITGNAYWMDVELKVEPGAVAGFKIAREKDKDNKIISETIIGYDAVKHQLFVDRANSGAGKINEDKGRQTIDLNDENGTIKLDILLDRSSLEIFVNKGESVLTTYIFPGEKANNMAAFSAGGNATIKSMKIWDLSKANDNQ